MSSISRPMTRRGRAMALVAAGVTVTGGSLVALAPGGAVASSHREAPLTAADPKIDNTDVYAFVSPDKADTVTMIANWIPFQEPAGGPNFYPFADDAHYNIKIDNNGDGVPDITYRWTFKSNYKDTNTFLYNTGPVNSLTDPTLNFTQTYTLEKIVGTAAPVAIVSNGKVAPSNVGMASMPNYAMLRDQAITPATGGGTSFVGQADDPFFLDLRVFDLLYGANLKSVGNDTLNGYNVNSVALQVPKSELLAAGGADPVIGVWSTTDRMSMRVLGADGTSKSSGDFVQVSRLGMPLVNEVVVPVALKDAFNALPPEKDKTVQAVVDKVNDPEVPKLIEKIYGIPAPAAPRDDIFGVFLTGVEGLNKPANVKPAEMLRLNTSIAPVAQGNRLGVLGGDKAGFPNGRRLSDDVVDIELQALEGALRPNPPAAVKTLGDGVNANDKAFGQTFPYLALPTSGSATRAASGSGTGSMPKGGVATGGGGTALQPAAASLPVLPVSLAILGLALTGVGALRLRRPRVLAPSA